MRKQDICKVPGCSDPIYHGYRMPKGHKRLCALHYTEFQMAVRQAARDKFLKEHPGDESGAVWAAIAAVDRFDGRED